MAKLYRSREGEATAVDTKTQLTTLGSETAPGPLLVPTGAKKLNAAIVAMSGNFAATGRSTAFVRIEGSGLPKGPEVVAVGALGVLVATGSNNALPAKRYPLNVDCTPGNEILLFGEMAGADTGQISFGVTLEFQK